MECKNCGGKILFQNGIGCCQSCGAKIALNSIYEKVDVFICYVECDAFGRRTKDSLIAHEVYRKLEESKISTFYERISADGFMGDDLEQIRLAAINQSKIILILGSSKENFAALEKKFLEFFDGKTVIPFCIDINPAEIPKTLSKIQALNYATIGWEKGLVNGVYNLLGRENEIDSVSVYAATRKRRFLAIGIVIALLFATAVVALLCVFDQHGENGDSKFSS